MYVNAVNGGVLYVTARDSGLVTGRVNGPRLIPIEERRFRIEGQPSELEFRPNGELVQHFTGWPARSPALLRRETVARHSPADLQRYAGTYFSEELGVSYPVTARDSVLALKTRWGTEMTVRAAFGDTFLGDVRAAFTRNRSGAIDGFLMGSGRVRNVRFVRQR